MDELTLTFKVDAHSDLIERKNVDVEILKILNPHGELGTIEGFLSDKEIKEIESLLESI